MSKDKDPFLKSHGKYVCLYYRIWDKTNKKFIMGNVVNKVGEVKKTYGGNHHGNREKNLIPLLYTGANDINNRRIYEHDVVMVTITQKGKTFSYPSLVQYLTKFCAWTPLTEYLTFQDSQPVTFEVVGNKYENPNWRELFKSMST